MATEWFPASAPSTGSQCSSSWVLCLSVPCSYLAAPDTQSMERTGLSSQRLEGFLGQRQMSQVRPAHLVLSLANLTTYLGLRMGCWNCPVFHRRPLSASLSQVPAQRDLPSRRTLSWAAVGKLGWAGTLGRALLEYLGEEMFVAL